MDEKKEQIDKLFRFMWNIVIYLLNRLRGPSIRDSAVLSTKMDKYVAEAQCLRT